MSHHQARIISQSINQAINQIINLTINIISISVINQEINQDQNQDQDQGQCLNQGHQIIIEDPAPNQDQGQSHLVVSRGTHHQPLTVSEENLAEGAKVDIHLENVLLKDINAVSVAI